MRTTCFLIPAILFLFGSSLLGADRIPLLLRQLDCSARVLYITAHPDDEDAALVARLTHVDGADVALMTLTRGEGGQNEIGDELFAALGVLRSRELEAAHRLDGAIQYYSHARDFGYSFSVEETYERWGRVRILKDIVAVIREFRPDVILTMKPDGGGGGQHHQASARLAQEAFVLAADDERWPELGRPHMVKRLFRQVGRDESDVSLLCEMEVGLSDPILGASPLEIGALSRGMHKCQGMVFQHEPFERRRSRWQWLLAAPGVDRKPLPHVLDGIGIPFDDDGEMAQVWREFVQAARQSHEPEAPVMAMESLVNLWLLLEEYENGDGMRDGDSVPWFRADLREAITLALGLRMSARVKDPRAAAGVNVPVQFVVANGGPMQVTLSVATASRVGLEHTEAVEITIDAGVREELALELRTSSAGYSLPRAVPTDPMSTDRAAFLRPNWRGFWCDVRMEVGGKYIRLDDVAMEAEWVDARFPQLRYGDLQTVPDPSIRFADRVAVAPFEVGEQPVVDVELLVSTRAGGKVEVELDAPGWQVVPEKRVVETEGGGVESRVKARLTGARGVAMESSLVARARHGGEGAWSSLGYRTIDHPHVRSDALLVKAETRLVSFPCRVNRKRVIGYVEGTGDRVLAAIERLGMKTRLLTEAELASDSLAGVDVIVSGVRAFKVREDLAAAWPRIRAWMERGGTFICQYNKFEFNASADESPWAPYPGARVSRNRVTDENAPVSVRKPEHALFKEPNDIGSPDWQGWVQERGLYFLEVTGNEYTDLLSIEEPFPYNAGEKTGALVHAEVGKGHWVYVGLGLFRQLPAGVPGAFRLLANLLAL